MSLDTTDAGQHILCVRIGDSIAEARRAAGRSQLWLANAVGTGQTTISSWERNRTEPTREDVVRVADALELPVAQLEGHSATRDSRQDVPVVGYIGAGDAAHFYSVDQGELECVEAMEGSGPGTVARQIKGESIGSFFEGWLVFTEPRQPGVPSAYLGELCEVHLPDGRILVKKVVKSKFEGLYHLLSTTEPPMMDEEVEWSARVTGMRPR